MVLLSSAQWRSGLLVSLSGVLAKSGGCAVDEICGDERRVRRSRVCNWTLLLEVLSTVWDSITCVDSDSARWTRDEGDYFSMNTGIVQNERPTTRSYLSKSHEWACRWAMEKLAF